MGWFSKIFVSDNEKAANSEMIKTIEDLFLNKDTLSDYNKRIIEMTINKFSPEAIAELKNDILQVVHKAYETKEPLQFLRSTLMNIIESSCLNSALIDLDDEKRKSLRTIGEGFSEEAILATFIGNEFQSLCLRLYCINNFSDGCKNDWFSLYTEAAKAHGKHRANLLCASVGQHESDPAFLAHLGKQYEVAMEELRNKLLHTPVGTTFQEDQPNKSYPPDRYAPVDFSVKFKAKEEQEDK